MTSIKSENLIVSNTTTSCLSNDTSNQPTITTSNQSLSTITNVNILQNNNNNNNNYNNNTTNNNNNSNNSNNNNNNNNNIGSTYQIMSVHLNDQENITCVTPTQSVTTTTASSTQSTVISTTKTSSSSLTLTASIPTTTTTTITSTTTNSRNNVSVTNIKCEVDETLVTDMCADDSSSHFNPILNPVITSTINYYNGTSNSSSGTIRIPLTKIEDSDSETELTNIENLKVTRRLNTPSAQSSNSCKNGPRPMSWEGELSEPETSGEATELMETDNSLSNSVMDASINLTIDNQRHNTITPSSNGAKQIETLDAKTLIKPEIEIHNHIYNSPSLPLQNPPNKLKLAPTQSDPINLKYEPPDLNSPLLTRQKSISGQPQGLPLPANPSPDSAIHSVYTHSSPSQSPLTSRHAPYTPSLSRNNSDASHSSCYSYSSEFSPTHSPIQGRHAAVPVNSGTNILYSNYNNSNHHTLYHRTLDSSEIQNLSMDITPPTTTLPTSTDGLSPSPAGISRQQLINSPCPICGDKISGFHYGIFSCESCKGFFKRTVQNRKNYVCVRGGPCPVSISTRKKCPACRFDKCLQKGMKLEAIREDRTRGGRSTYQCSYTLPTTMLLSPEQQNPVSSTMTTSNQQMQTQQQQQQQQQHRLSLPSITQQQNQRHHQGLNSLLAASGCSLNEDLSSSNCATFKNEYQGTNVIVNNGVLTGLSHTTTSVIKTEAQPNTIPVLLQEIMDVEHLWQYNEAELSRLNQPLGSNSSCGRTNEPSSTNSVTNPLLASAGLSSNGEHGNPDLIAHLCNVADHRLYKIVKWCKSLPLFKNISIDDQICLLINSWCELLLFSCCYRSIDTPGEIKMSQGKRITLAQAKSSGLQACIERMLNLTDHLRRLRVDRYEYVAMKVIVLLQSDTSELREPVKVRECQEKALQSLQAYTLAHYPDTTSKFGELLLRIPDLQRTCQLGKEMLTIKSRDGGDFNLLMELLRGEH